jgi:hypothetical protein
MAAIEFRCAEFTKPGSYKLQLVTGQEHRS